MGGIDAPECKTWRERSTESNFAPFPATVQTSSGRGLIFRTAHSDGHPENAGAGGPIHAPPVFIQWRVRRTRVPGASLGELPITRSPHPNRAHNEPLEPIPRLGAIGVARSATAELPLDHEQRHRAFRRLLLLRVPQRESGYRRARLNAANPRRNTRGLPMRIGGPLRVRAPPAALHSPRGRMIIVTRPDITDAELDHIRERVETAACAPTSRAASSARSSAASATRRCCRRCRSARFPAWSRSRRCSSRTSSPRASSRVDRTRRPRRRRGGRRIGGNAIAVIAGPCSVENREMLRRDRASPCATPARRMLRGGAFKPRTSPYASRGSARGARAAGRGARRDRAAGGDRGDGHARRSSWSPSTPTCCRSARATCRTSRCSPSSGRVQRPVLLKRGLSATIEELLMAAEYIMAQGNHDVVLCERGIRTFETRHAQHARRRRRSPCSSGRRTCR